MQSLLDRILSRHSPLVIGYAGWEGDVIMTALLRRLKSGLSNNLYWFCYRRTDAEMLPSWLRDNRDVRVVLPPVPANKLDSQPASDAKLGSLAIGSEPTLTAQSVLDKLVDAFTETSPALTLDPIGFFAGQLKNSFPLDPSDKPGEDIYSLRDVIRRVELAKEGEKTPTPLEAEIESVRDAVRRSAYLEALQTASQLGPKLTSDTQREMLVESVTSAAVGLNDNSEAEIGGYDLALGLAAGSAHTSARTQDRVALALFNKGIALGQLNRAEEEIQSYNEVLRRFGDASEAELRERVAMALFNKCVTLAELNRPEEAIQGYNEALRRFGDGTEPALREAVAKTLFNKGVTLGKLNRSEEAIQTYDEALQRFGDATEPAVREQVAMSLFNRSGTLSRLDRSEEAIRSYDELPRRFGDATEPVARELVAKALVNKGVTLGGLNRGEEEIQSYDEVLRRFGDATEPVLREQIAMALVNKGVALSKLNRNEEEIQSYDEVLRRFGDATEPEERRQVAKALAYKGQTLSTLKRPQEARSSFQEVLKRFADSPDGAIQQLVEKAKAELKSLDEANL